MGRAQSTRWRRPGAGLLGVVLAGAALSALGVVPAGAASDPGTTTSGPGRVLFRDPVGTDTSATTARRAIAATAAFPLAQTFALHSLPGSQHTIFLDFDGATVADTAWNAPDIGARARDYRGWVLDAQDPLSDTELADIQSIWQRVAEDYAPFDVDVTTADPGAAALDPQRARATRRTARARWSSPSNAAMSVVCAGPAAGMAYVGVFDLTIRPRLLPAGLGVPEEALGQRREGHRRGGSHEVGHNLGLRPRRQRPRTATTPGRAAGRRSWGSATTGRSPSGAAASTPARTTSRTTLR